MPSSPPRTVRAPSAALAARVRRAREGGGPLAALDALGGAARRPPRRVGAARLWAQALLDVGAAEEALRVLEGLRARGRSDAETLGLRARALKDLAERRLQPARRRAGLVTALEAYREVHDAHPGDTWAGINAAGLALRLGRASLAARLARGVERRCRAALPAGPWPAPLRRYWRLATRAEAALVLGRLEAAARLYARAAATPGVGLAERASTLRNARRLFGVRPRARHAVERALALPPVLAYCGHRLDHAGRPAPRLPRTAEAALRPRVRAALERLGPAVLYGSAAAGADLVILEEAQALGLATHVVLPYERGAFRRDCVAYAGAGGAGPRFERVLARAARVEVVSDRPIPEGSHTVELANTVVFGLARAHARRLEARVVGLAVWDGRPGDGPGGTSWIVQRLWRPAGVPVTVLAPRVIGPAAAPPVARPGPSGARPVPSPSSPSPSIARRAVLFADVRGFSRLEEAQVPAFVRHVLGGAAALARRFGHGLEMRNTWGDGLAFVFDRVERAGRFALELVERVRAARGRDGLPTDLDLRVGLHAGPVHAFTDPVTGQPGRSGRHVVLAARLEPVTPPGCVYATQTFAALAEAEGVQSFACDYVGRVDLAKEAGVHPVYRVRRAETAP